jgi:hypothetical protein
VKRVEQGARGGRPACHTREMGVIYDMWAPLRWWQQKTMMWHHVYKNHLK